MSQERRENLNSCRCRWRGSGSDPSFSKFGAEVLGTSGFEAKRHDLMNEYGIQADFIFNTHNTSGETLSSGTFGSIEEFSGGPG